VNILSRRAGQHILHVGRPLGRLEGGSVGHWHADVPEPAFMRSRQRVGREEPPGLLSRIAEGMPHAAGNPNERAGRCFNPLVSTEEDSLCQAFLGAIWSEEKIHASEEKGNAFHVA
jgi:hypothetical protein